MSDRIEVELSAERIVTNPGEKAEVSVNIRNTSEIVEVFSIEVEGIESSWYSTSVSSVSLFPGDKDTILVSFSPPLSSASGAGSYIATVKVSSRRDPTITSTANLSLELGKISSYELDLMPKKVRGGKGSFEVIINNTGNLTNTYKLEASDPGAMCNYAFRSDTIVVEAGRVSKILLTVTPKNRPFTGAAKSCNFTVTVTPIASEVKSVQGQLEYPARFPKWALIALIASVAIVILAIALVVVLVLVFINDSSSKTYYPEYDNMVVWSDTDGWEILADGNFPEDELSVGNCGLYIEEQYVYADYASALYFEIDSYIEGKTIKEAVLKLTPVPDFLPTDFDILYYASPIDDSWLPTTLTYNNLDVNLDLDYSSSEYPPDTDEQAWEIDITDMVQAWADGDIHNYGVVLWGYDTDYTPEYEYSRACDFYSTDTAESNSQRPQLRIEIS